MNSYFKEVTVFKGKTFRSDETRGNFKMVERGQTREKLTVKKIINKEMFFFYRLCPLQTVKNRRKP